MSQELFLSRDGVWGDLRSSNAANHQRAEGSKGKNLKSKPFSPAVTCMWGGQQFTFSF
jgi:hypothetical protein